MVLSTGPVLAAAILLSHVVAGQDNRFWRFIDPTRFSINIITTRPTFVKFKGSDTWLIKGDPADVGEYPFMVFIELSESGGRTICGGTLLSNTWVLTAAHCLDGRTVTKILIGARKNDGSDPNAVTRYMETPCCHKDFKLETFANDICLIKLSSPVTYGNYIKEAKLPPAKSKAPDGSTGIAMGWGLNELGVAPTVLQWGEVKVVNKAQCESWYSQDGEKVPDHHFCAGLGGLKAPDTCKGDSGGPLVIKEDGEFVLRGITSFGPKDCGEAERPGVYTRVSSYIDWINRKMHQPCKEYTWGPWLPTCSVACGTGTETSTRECRDEDGVATSSTNCPGLPTKTGTCTRPPCKEYRWGTWQKTCHVTCGTGAEQRRRNCLDELDTIVSMSFCSPGRSGEIGTCHLQPCPIYEWGPWKGSCSVTCGTGVQTRTRQCLDQNRNPVSVALCGPGAASENGACHNPPCKSYSWSPWITACSVTCGSGTETKRRQCEDRNGKTVAASLCTPGGGVEHRSCLKAPCNVYGWGPWKGSCSVTCGTGVQTRTRQCLDQNQNPISEALCGPGPTSENGACDNAPCKSYSWSPWITTCSVTCGSGTETKIRQCEDHNGKTFAASLCSPGGSVEYGLCMKAPCNGALLQAYRWSPWTTTCSVTCGSGTETKRRQCVDLNEKTAAASLCSPGEVVDYGSCMKAPCNSYSWSPWITTCSVTCGSGSETKRRQCVDNNGKTVAASLCPPGGGVEYGSCMKAPCNVLQRFHWGSWRKHCSVTCGDGMELNFRQCLDSNGIGVASTHCSPGNEVERRKCSLPPCNTGYEWGPWKVTCSVSCGRGSEVKARQCVNHKLESVNVRNCKGISLETGNCVQPPCPSDSPFQWGPWKTWSRCRINTLAANRCAGFQSTTRDCLHMGRDADPYRCISTIGGDYYREATCNMYGC